MRYCIKEKFWALGNNFHIMDDCNEPVYRVDGAAFSWGDKLSFQDMAGSEVAHISQKLLSFMPTYTVYRDGQLFAEVKKEWSWFRKQFALDVPDPNDYTIDGSFWERDYVFKRGGRNVASVSRHYFAFTDTYGVDIVDGEDDVAILATCIVIDQVLHDEKD
jgi:uncharacterized protein YxjI